MYCALIAYIIFEAPAEDRNINTLVDMISGMDVKEDDESYMNAVDYMFKGLEKRKPDCFAVKRFVRCFFELLTQILVKVRKCKVQRVCVLHFQLAGSGGCFFLMKLYH